MSRRSITSRTCLPSSQTPHFLPSGRAARSEAPHQTPSCRGAGERSFLDDTLPMRTGTGQFGSFTNANCLRCAQSDVCSESLGLSSIGDGQCNPFLVRCTRVRMGPVQARWHEACFGHSGVQQRMRSWPLLNTKCRAAITKHACILLSVLSCHSQEVHVTDRPLMRTTRPVRIEPTAAWPAAELSSLPASRSRIKLRSTLPNDLLACSRWQTLVLHLKWNT